VLVTLLKAYFRADRFCRLQPSPLRPNLRARNAFAGRDDRIRASRRWPPETVDIGVRSCFSVREAVPRDLGVLALLCAGLFAVNASMYNKENELSWVWAASCDIQLRVTTAFIVSHFQALQRHLQRPPACSRIHCARMRYAECALWRTRAYENTGSCICRTFEADHSIQLLITNCGSQPHFRFFERG